MNLLRIILISSILFFLSSCSLFKGSKNKKAEKPSESSKGKDRSDDLLDTGDDPLPGTEMVEDSSSLSESESPTISDQPLPLGQLGKEMNYYQVEPNDTLMLISFKLYGDYRRWKRIQALNPDLIKDNQVAPGSKLKYYPLATPFEWSPKGNPYLIKLGDTLGKISNQVYKSPKKWKYIWNNNKPMIQNPNLIFAGFTLYYLDEADLMAWNE